MPNNLSKKVWAVFLLCGLIFSSTALIPASLPSVHAAHTEDTGWADYDNYIVIDHNMTWSGQITRTDIPKPVVVVNGATLTIEKGAHIEIGTLTVYDGRIVALGTEQEKIVFAKQAPDLSWVSPEDLAQYDDECFMGEGGMIEFSDWPVTGEEEPSFFRHVEFDGMGTYLQFDSDNCPSMTMDDSHRSIFSTAYAAPQTTYNPALRFRSGRLHIENSGFKNNDYADIETDMSFSDEWDSYDALQVINSNFEGNTQNIALISNLKYGGEQTEDHSYRVLLRNNWYGSPSGPMTAENPAGEGEIITGTFQLDGWSTIEFSSACAENCYSNVMFLPGIKASRLYKDGALGTEDQLWLPNLFGDDLEDLALDEDGQSRNTVYTRDVLDEIVTGNIYESFLNQLQNLKSDGTVEDYQAFAYDWRKNVEDIVREGTLYPEGVMRSAIADLQTLSASSKSKKVTIVAHSNGGLLAKAMMLELEKQGVADTVDKIVFVGTPQMGTPLAVLSLLYGYDEPIPVLLSQAEARTLAETMPGAYGLLPSEKYFDRVADPFITFSSERTRYKDFKDAYGEKINSFGEFGEFLSGSGDGRSEPDNDDVGMENTLREKFLTQAEETHGRLDGWVPPSDVEVIQIAGWGLDTVSGVEYAEKEKTRCYSVGRIVPSCVGTGEYEPVYDPKFTVDGDAVVVSPSALMLSEADNVKRYWVDLYQHNDNNVTDRKHRDLLEINSVRNFLSSIITNDEAAPLPEFLKTSRPDNYDGAAPRLRMSLYSPLDIHLYDEDGRHTGPKKTVIDGHEVTMFEEDIPNSYYYRFGDRKYVGFGTGENVRVEMDGYAEGSYTLELEEVQTTIDGEEVIAHTVFENLPTTTDTAVTLDVPETGLADMTALEADIDGDGTNDYAVAPVLNGTATLDVIAPTTDVSLAGTQGTNAWYVSDVAVTLTAVDDEGGSGVEKTEYSLDNETTWNTYLEPFDVSEENITDIQYFSIDNQGNREETKTMVVKIDKTAPEANIAFNPSTQKLDIIGKDNVSQSVSVVTAEASVNQFPKAVSGKIKFWFSNWLRKEKKILVTTTLTDEAGHKTEIVFEKKKDKQRRIDLVLQSISYDGEKTMLSKTLLQYKWRLDWKRKYRLFASHIRTDDNVIESHYVPKKDETILMERPRELDDDSDDDADRRSTRTRLPGMVIPGILTEMRQVKVNY